MSGDKMRESVRNKTEKLLPRLRVLVAAVGLATAPMVEKAHAETAGWFTHISPNVTHGDFNWDRYRDRGRIERREAKEWRDFLTTFKEGSELLTLDIDIRQAVRDILKNTRQCQERPLSAWEKDVQDATRQITWYLDRQNSFQNLLRDLPRFGKDISLTQVSPEPQMLKEESYEASLGENPVSNNDYFHDYEEYFADFSSFEEGKGGDRKIDFNDVPQRHIEELAARGRALLNDLRQYGSTVEGNVRVQRALKYVFPAAGCPMS